MSTDRDIPRQAGVLPFRRTSSGVQILLVTSNTRKRWIIPKGNVEPGLGEVESARREAMEEAGVKGTVKRVPLGSYLHRGSEGVSQVWVYLMEVERVLESWPEAEVRRREWMSIRAAHDRILEAGLKALLLEFTEESL